MDDLIKRKDAIDAMTDDNIIRNMDSVYDCALNRIRRSITRILAGLPSAKPNTKEHSQHVESVGCVGDTISRQAAIEALDGKVNITGRENAEAVIGYMRIVADRLKRLPPAQPEIIRCNSCKHWTQSTGKMKGYGLGRCDFHDVDLVTCNGFCYWAERRTDG